MDITEKARSLRKNQTEAERLLWRHLRNRQLCQAKFRRQFPINPYIVDFACLELKLIIELDGGHHAEQISYDEKRDFFLKQQGFKILRFWNNDVTGNLEGVLERVRLTVLQMRGE